MNSQSPAGSGQALSLGPDTLRESEPPAYVVVSAVRDEEANIGNLIESVLRQTMRPIEWVIVDDGSHDRTADIARKYAETEPWIHVLRRKDRGFRRSGGGVMEAFYDGFASLRSADWDFLVKLDGDLSFSEDYFQRCLRRFANNPKLGIGGGVIAYAADGGGLRLEVTHAFHVRGATKIYKRQCWSEIGGLIVAPGWDTLDEVKANMLGWQSRTFDDIPIIQHRQTGAADGSWKDNFKNGRANYICGYHPLFMMLKCVKRIFQRPFLVGSAGLAAGFLTGYLKGLPQVADRDVIRYLRQQQMQRLRFKQSIWK